MTDTEADLIETMARAILSNEYGGRDLPWNDPWYVAQLPERRALARAALAVARPRIWREAMEAAASVLADQWSYTEAEWVRALKPPSAEPHNVGKSVEPYTE